MPDLPLLRIGTRKSPLALVQAEIVKKQLQTAHSELRQEGAIALVPMTTTGDVLLSVPLAEVGGKGLFTKELEEALLKNTVDIAVHSSKDMQTVLPGELALVCVLEREDPRDCFISPHYQTIDQLPENAIVGTASLRRAAQMLRQRPDVCIQPLRGNVQTRLAKLERGEVHATLLAMAGLNRLGLDPFPGVPLPLEQFLPAVGQGIIGIEARVNDTKVAKWLAPLNHVPSMHALLAERSLLATLDGSCRTPIAGYAQVNEDKLMMQAMLASADGRTCWFADGQANVVDAIQLGHHVAQQLLAQKR